MLRHLQQTVVALLVAGAVHSAPAFSMLGPYEAWQTPDIGYNPVGGDIGGPMNLGEEYRWNVKTITYGFDESFLNYFGQDGVTAVNKAFALLNNLPAFSQTSSNLLEFSTDTRRDNYQASALALLDLKSYVLGTLMEEVGLASPDRYVWTLRSRVVINNLPLYTVIRRNFDPATLAPSSYVNGVLYTYTILPITIDPFYDAIEIPVDPLAVGPTAVASSIDDLLGLGLGFGQFFVGLTRDDVGGLRYLYRPNNYNIENLIPGTTGSSVGSPYLPYDPNATNRNAVVDTALRPGVNHLTFVQGQYDSMVGNFITITNQYQDTYVSNSTAITQSAQRILTQPDILIMAEDLGVNANGIPLIMRRTGTVAPIWVNNNGINGQGVNAGPGQINGQVVISLSKVGPYIRNAGPLNGQSSLTEETGNSSFVWGSFDATTNAPIVYPTGSSIYELEQQIFGGN